MSEETAGHRILITDIAWPSTAPEREVLAELDAEVVESDSPDEDRLVELAQDVTGILACFAKVTEPVIAASPRLRVVGRTGVGTDNIDVDACTRRGIPVTYVPDYAIEEVADHAMALLMAFSRKIVALDRLTKAGRWETKPARPIHRLRGRTLGILGYGRIGHALALRAIPHGFKILVFDPYITADRVADIGAELVSKERLLAESDAISVHAPLTPETHHVIGEAELRAMKPEACLINTARGRWWTNTRWRGRWPKAGSPVPASTCWRPSRRRRVTRCSPSRTPSSRHTPPSCPRNRCSSSSRARRWPSCASSRAACPSSSGTARCWSR